MKTADKTKPAPTRDKLLDAALGLMLDRGFAATGVEDVCRVAKVTKGSFFHYFKTKEDLGKAVLDRFWLGMQDVAGKSPHLRKEDPLERVLGWMEFVSEHSRQPQTLKGCLLGTFAQELARTHESMRQECDFKFSEWTGRIRQDLDLAVARHRPGASLNTSSLADHLVAALEGAIILAKARGNGRPIRETMEHCKSYVKSLFGK
jgi:TetR/AcrR family transcriptional repressor of nem operon